MINDDNGTGDEEKTFWERQAIVWEEYGQWDRRKTSNGIRCHFFPLYRKVVFILYKDTSFIDERGYDRFSSPYKIRIKCCVSYNSKNLALVVAQHRF